MGIAVKSRNTTANGARNSQATAVSAGAPRSAALCAATPGRAVVVIGGHFVPVPRRRRTTGCSRRPLGGLLALGDGSISLPSRVATCGQVLTCGKAARVLQLGEEGVQERLVRDRRVVPGGDTAGSEPYALNCATWVLRLREVPDELPGRVGVVGVGEHPQLPPAEKQTLPADPAGAGRSRMGGASSRPSSRRRRAGR